MSEESTRRTNSRRRVMLLLPFLGLAGCSNAIVDAASAGGLSFVQNSVMTLLSQVVFPESSASVGEIDMTGMASMADGGDEHQDHGG